MNNRPLYSALIRFGLSECATLADFERLTEEQADHMAACWREAPGVAREIWKMAGEAKRRLENTPA